MPLHPGLLRLPTLPAMPLPPFAFFRRALPLYRLARPAALGAARVVLVLALGSLAGVASAAPPAALPTVPATGSTAHTSNTAHMSHTGGMGDTGDTALPPAVQAALARAHVPLDAVALLVLPVDGRAAPRLSHRAQVPMNPASVMKLVTTFAGLDLLGPAYTWSTPVYLDGAVQDGALRGNVYIRGQGDPALVLERLWLLLRRLQGQGVQAIVGDIVLDHSAFSVPAHDAALFDGEPQRPYNAAPDALLVNFKSVAMGFVPDVAAGVAHVQFDPPLAGVQAPRQVALAPAGTACGDWRAGLKAELADPARWAFAGAYPATCGERSWSVAYAEPARYAARAIEGLWREMGGKLTGSVRPGSVPAHLLPTFSATSPPLAQVVRDINKYSNNVMAQQLFLTLGLPPRANASANANANASASANAGAAPLPATAASARAALRPWWQARVGRQVPLPDVDNGSGLSRDGRASAESLARMLQAAWATPVMPELLASLPIAGADGTLRRSRLASGQSAGRAHLKTGSLQGVLALAGYVHGDGGQRQVLVALVNHPDAAAARPALDALVEWAVRGR